MKDGLEHLVEEAKAGDRIALEDVLRGIQDAVHHLAMRILVNPDDALDATQEILISVVTKLSTFEGKSAFKTWVYRVAVNYLLNAKKVRDRDAGLTFEAFQADLHEGLVIDPSPSSEDELLLSEMRISCTMAMLLCLDLKHRLAYVLGDILEFDHNQAAEVLGITKANFRQRLSRARNEVIAFTSNHCGIASETASCSCPGRLPAAVKLGRIQKNNIVYASQSDPSYHEILKQARTVEENLRTLLLQRSTPYYSCPEDLGEKLTDIVSGDTQ